MKQCEKCQKEFKTNGALGNHIKYCKGIKIKEDWKCPLCNYIIKCNREKHLKYCNGLGPRRKRSFIDKSGLTKKEIKSAIAKKLWNNEEYRLKCKLNHSNGGGKPKTEELNNIKKEKIRNAINIRYSNGWMPKAGRTKKIKYTSKVAGDVTLDGKWELLVAKYFDNLNLQWKRNTKRFKYINLKNMEAHYTPDFWIEDWKCFVEVKGYETDLDKCKWLQFNEPLKIWKKEEIFNIKKEFIEIWKEVFNN